MLGMGRLDGLMAGIRQYFDNQHSKVRHQLGVNIDGLIGQLKIEVMSTLCSALRRPFNRGRIGRTLKTRWVHCSDVVVIRREVRHQLGAVFAQNDAAGTMLTGQ
jgi:hypothetical protein